MYNRVILIGNLTRDPELRYISSGSAVTRFGLATERVYKVGEEKKRDVTFIDIVVWARQAEICAEYLSKGRQVAVEGRLSYNTWETDDGRKMSKHEVVADRVVFLRDGSRDSKRSDSSDESGSLEEPGSGRSSGRESALGTGSTPEPRERPDPDYDDVPF